MRVGRSLTIPLDELDWRFTASGGPGGQHANTANTRAELRFDIEASPSLGPRQRARLLERYGRVLRVVSATHRSQLRNRHDAIERLTDMLADGLRVKTVRRPTGPSRGAVERRLADKRKRADAKRARRSPSPDD
ncbi:MAG: ribosome-associated protein [Acidimicrobiaceae bacterium]|nr:ribosome-associated protein [Acidimicrobiaceae bacterium]